MNKAQWHMVEELRSENKRLKAENITLRGKLSTLVGDESGAAPTAMREALASISHEIWAHWMAYLFNLCDEEVDTSRLGYVIKWEHAKHWLRQIQTDYVDLTEAEKDSDREQADKILKVIQEAGLIK